MSDPSLLRILLANRRKGYSLEAPFYLDPEICRLDTEMIFGRHWIFVGVAPQASEPGDFFTVEIGSNSIIIVRNDDMELRAFHNVCRHRGSRICQTSSGTTGNLVCPYHQWTYNLSGDLIHADRMASTVDLATLSLKRVHLRNLEGLIFICLARNPPADFDSMAESIAPYLAPHRLEECKVAAQTDLIEHGNWKLTMENNRECYHCVAQHPELINSMFEHGFGYEVDGEDEQAQIYYDQLVCESQERWEKMGLPSTEIDQLDGRETGFRVIRLPLDRTGQSQTLNTEVASRRLLGDFTDPALGGLSVWTQPNSWHHFMSDHVVSFSALPIDATRTLVRTTWCVHKDAIEDVDYTVENLTAVWAATNAQDSQLVQEVQIGVASSAYSPGPYSLVAEGLVESFCRWYAGNMSQHVEK